MYKNGRSQAIEHQSVVFFRIRIKLGFADVIPHNGSANGMYGYGGESAQGGGMNIKLKSLQQIF